MIEKSPHATNKIKINHKLDLDNIESNKLSEGLLTQKEIVYFINYLFSIICGRNRNERLLPTYKIQIQYTNVHTNERLRDYKQQNSEKPISSAVPIRMPEIWDHTSQYKKHNETPGNVL